MLFLTFTVIFFCLFIVSANVISTVPTTLIASVGTRKCTMDVTSNGCISADKYCEIQRIIKAADFEQAIIAFAENSANNFHDQLYFKVSMDVRYIVTEYSMDASVSNFSVILEVSQDNDIVMTTRMPFVVDTSDLGLSVLSSTYSDWTAYSTTFQRVPSQQSPTTVTVRIINDVDVPSGFDGYLEIKNMIIEGFPQRGKFEFSSPKSTDHKSDSVNGKEDDHCSLLGNINALVLNNISVDSLYTTERSVTVFCAVYSIERNHNRVKTVRDTWGRKCTAFLAFSDVADDSIPSICIPHLGIESYGNIWQKVRSILKYVHLQYRDEFDYFLIGGDDMYYVMENLYSYLNSDEIQTLQREGRGLYLGREFDHNDREVMYNTGGPGYILNKVSLQILVNGLGRCNSKMFVSCEDVFVAFCLMHLGGIVPHNTSDNLNRYMSFDILFGFAIYTINRPRWHNLPPGYLVRPQEVESQQVAAHLGRDIHLRFGEDCCSDRSIAFHYLEPELMRRIDNYIYRCPQEMKQQYYAEMGASYYDSSTLMTMSTVV